jgi:hypothetical protein
MTVNLTESGCELRLNLRGKVQRQVFERMVMLTCLTRATESC